jgi:hypothetical protein
MSKPAGHYLISQLAEGDRVRPAMADWVGTVAKVYPALYNIDGRTHVHVTPPAGQEVTIEGDAWTVVEVVND